MMKITALIPLILEINNSVDFLNSIPNVEEHNLEFVEELNIAMLKNLDQYANTVGLEFDLVELVTEFAVRGTCRGDSQLMELVKYFKNVF